MYKTQTIYFLCILYLKFWNIDHCFLFNIRHIFHGNRQSLKPILSLLFYFKKKSHLHKPILMFIFKYKYCNLRKKYCAIFDANTEKENLWGGKIRHNFLVNKKQTVFYILMKKKIIWESKQPAILEKQQLNLKKGIFLNIIKI